MGHLQILRRCAIRYNCKEKNLQQMIEDAQVKKFDIILAKELSRLARNGELSYKIKNLCENQGIHIITLDNAINTLTGKH
jgi:site-specific DNA recombinase